MPDLQTAYVDVQADQESKLGHRDVTPETKGYDSVRKHKESSEARRHCGGDFKNYVQQGL